MADEQSKSVGLKAARSLAKETMRNAVTTEWLARRRYMAASRGGKLVLPNVLEETEVQAIHARALAKLDDIAQHDPDPRWQLKALEILTNFELERMRIKAELDSKVSPRVVDAPADEPAVKDLTRDEKVELARSYLKLARGA